MSKLKLKNIQTEYAKISRAIDRVQTLVYRAEVLSQELEEVRRGTKEGDRLNSPYYKVNESLGQVCTHLKPIFEKHAGRAAISEAK